MKDRALSLGPRLRRRIGSRKRPTLAPRRLLSIRFREGFFFVFFNPFDAERGIRGHRITAQWVLDKRNIKMEGKYWKSGRRFGLNVHTLRWYVLIGLSLVDYTWPRRYVDIRPHSFLRYVHHPLGYEFGVELRNFDIYRKLIHPTRKRRPYKSPTSRMDMRLDIIHFTHW